MSGLVIRGWWGGGAGICCVGVCVLVDGEELE